MIEVRVRFWTNKIASAGMISPKQAWASGVVSMDKNESHGISPKDPKPFRSLLQLSAVIEEVLIEQGIMLHPGKHMSKYVTTYEE